MLKPVARPRLPEYAMHAIGGRVFRVARWRCRGRSASRPLLFFSGIGANIELLAPFLDHLEGRDIITFDMPGIGGSSARGGPYRLSAMAGAADRILTDLGYGDVDVMGVSWGGMLAQEFAYRYPRRVARLVLAATSTGIPMIPGKLSALMKMVGLRRYADPASMLPFLQSLYGGKGNDLETYPQRMQLPSSTGYRYQLLAIAGWTSVRKLTRLAVPTLILMGRDDKLVPAANGHILKFLIEGAQLTIIENAGHLFLLTHLREVGGMVEAFLGQGTREDFGACEQYGAFAT